MGASEIEDEASLRRWLESLPRTTDQEQDRVRRVAVAIAHRHAMRGVDFFCKLATRIRSRALDLETLASFRCLLISGVAAVRSTPEVRAAAGAARADSPDFTRAAAAARAAAAGSVFSTSADSAIFASTFALCNVFNDDVLVELLARGLGKDPAVVTQQANAFRAAAAALKRDCIAWEDGATLETTPLWPDTNPVEALWQAERALLHNRRIWGFWVDWYDLALLGKPQDWTGLLTDIALLPSEDWQKGPEHIAMLISRFRRDRYFRTPWNPANITTRPDPLPARSTEKNVAKEPGET